MNDTDIKIYCSKCGQLKNILKKDKDNYILYCGHRIEFNIEGGQWSAG